MAYETLQQFINRTNQTGLDGNFVYVAQLVPGFIPFLLFTFFIIILLNSYYIPRNLTSKGDFVASFAVAGYTTAIIAIMMTLVPGLINPSIVIIAIIIAVAGTLWLYFNR